MEKLLCCFWLFLLLGIVPLVTGLPWTRLMDDRPSYAFAYSIGYFMQLAVFQLAMILAILIRGKFIAIVWIYTALMLAVCVWSVWFVRKNGIHPVGLKLVQMSTFEVIYLCAFAVVVSIQIFRGFSYALTYMSLDDATYTVAAQQALQGQGLGTVDFATGGAMIFNLQRGLPGWYYYQAYLAFLSKISVATMEHTVQYVQLILLAYTVYWYMAEALFAERQNRLIFLLFVALFYWYGYHSHYSLTFRLLGPNYQGKAVLAVSLTPLLFTLLAKKLQEPYQRRFSLLVFFLSVAACSLTFWGAGTFLVILALPVLISLLQKGKDFRFLYYIFSGSVCPALVAFLFYIMKYAV